MLFLTLCRFPRAPIRPLFLTETRSVSFLPPFLCFNVSTPFGEPLLRYNDLRTRFSFSESILHRVGFSCGKSTVPACRREIPHEKRRSYVSRKFPVVNRWTPLACGAEGLPEISRGHPPPLGRASREGVVRVFPARRERAPRSRS